MKELEIGAKVRWRSQSGGIEKTKIGKVVHIIKRSDLRNIRITYPISIANKLFPNHKRMFDGCSIPGGYETGYFVEVIAGPKAKPRLYMPNPKWLREVE